MHPLLGVWRCPSVCEICARWPAQPVCDHCRLDLGPVLPRCPGCALPLAPGLSRCARCTESPPTGLQRCMARVDYTYPWSGIVQRFKFQGEPAWARCLAGLMLEDPHTAAAVAGADWIAPIPLPLPRLLERGYNQSWELVRQLRRQTAQAAPARADLLQRDDAAPAIHTLPRAQRLDHASHAFRLGADARAAVQHAHVLLVDDVMTTGATLQAAAQVLLAAGAASVSGLVFARTPAPGSME